MYCLDCSGLGAKWAWGGFLGWVFGVSGQSCPLLAVLLLVSLNNLVPKVFCSDASSAKNELCF